MGAFARWLLHDDQKELFEVVFAAALNAVFLALAALALWPLGAAGAALRLAKGYWVFWSVMYLTGALLIRIRQALRVDIDTHFDAYVISALAVGGVLQAGWSAFAALTVGGFAAGASAWAAVALYAVGLLSCWVAYGVLSSFYMGSIYRTVNLPLAALSFALFCVWPAGARGAFGWFFDIFPGW